MRDDVGKEGNREVFCIKTEIPEELNAIDDELKAIYHSSDSVCVFVFQSRDERLRFQDETQGMMKEERLRIYELHRLELPNGRNKSTD